MLYIECKSKNPQEVGSMSEKQLHILMACHLSIRYEVNQLRAVPDIIYSCTEFFSDLCEQIISTHYSSRFWPIVSVSNNLFHYHVHLSFQPSPAKVPLYGTPRRTRLDHPYSMARMVDVGIQTETRHVTIKLSADPSVTPPLAQPLDTELSDQDDSPAMESGSSYRPSSRSSVSTDTDSTTHGSPVTSSVNKYVILGTNLMNFWPTAVSVVSQ